MVLLVAAGGGVVAVLVVIVVAVGFAVVGATAEGLAAAFNYI